MTFVDGAAIEFDYKW